MILNHSKCYIPTARVIIIVSCAQLGLLVVLLSCTTPACFSTFYRCAMVPTQVENCVLVIDRNSLVFVSSLAHFIGCLCIRKVL